MAKFTMQKKGDVGEIKIYDDIGMFGLTYANFEEQYNKIAAPAKNINLWIHSLGGDILDGNAIYDLILTRSADTIAHIVGMAASQAGVIAMAAKKITAYNNAWLMIHNPAAYNTFGDANKLRNEAAVLDEMKKFAVAAYKRHSNLSEKEISDLMDAETWMTAAAAKDKKFIEEIVDASEYSDIIGNSSMKIPARVMSAIYANNFKPFLKEGPMFKCLSCNLEIPEGVTVCPHCGKAVMKAPAAPAPAAPAQSVSEAVAAARVEFAARASEISSRCAALNIDRGFEAALIGGNDSLDVCIRKILDKVQAGKTAVPVPPQITFGADARDKFRAAAVKNLCVVHGLETDKAVISEVRGKGLPASYQDLVRECLIREGKNPATVARMRGEDIANATASSFKNAAEGSSDLPAILADTANKSIMAGAGQAGATFQEWCAEGSTTDFKTITVAGMSSFGDLKEIPEGADFEEAKVSDKKETGSLKTYGRSITLSRKAIINDDLSALVEVPRLMMIAFLQKINKLIYDSLTSGSLAGPLMTEDGNRLFDASNHVNIYDPSNVPSLTSLGVARKMFRAIKNLKAMNDETAYPGGRAPRYIISGPANETAIENVVNNTQIIQSSGTSTVNPYTAGGRTPLIPVIDDYLGDLVAAASKTYAWYLAANQALLPSYKVFYLNGNRTPIFRAENSGVGKALGIQYDVYCDCGIVLQDWRGLLYCDGDAS